MSSTTPWLLTLLALAVVAEGEQASYRWRVRGSAGGQTAAVALAGDAAYVATGLRVLVYDITEPAPREIGATIPFDDFVQDVEIVGDRAYVAAGKSGVHILDIANRGSPKHLATWDSPGSAEAVTVAGKTLYVADGPFGLQIVDLSDEATPRLITATFDDLFAFDVTRSGVHLFVAAAGSGLLVVDGTDPKKPGVVASLDTPGLARSVAVAGSVALVADQWEGIRVIDVTNPAAPRETGSVSLQSWAMDVVLDGSTGFVATGSAGLVVVDVSNPAAAQQIGSIDVAARTDSIGVATKTGRAYVAAGNGGLQAFDVANPRSPQRLGLATPLSNGFGVAFSPSHLLASDLKGLKVFDISSPDVPREVGRLATDVLPFCIATSGSFAYLGTDRLRAVDLSDPAHPAERGSVALNGPARDIEIGDDLLLVATEFDVAVVDIANRADPRLLATVPMVSGAYSAQAIGVTRLGRYAFVAQSQAGVAVVDLNVPTAPVIIQQYKPPGLDFAQSVRTDGRWLFIVNCGNVFVVDAADPRDLRLTSTLPSGICPYRMKLAGTRLFLAAGTRGFAEIDVSRPEAPTVVGSTLMPGFGFDVAVAGSLAAVAVENLGVVVLSADGASANKQASHVDAIAGDDLGRSVAANFADFERSLRPVTTARTIVVTSIGDQGAGTLRDALSSAEPGDSVMFDPNLFRPASPAVIRPASALPCIKARVTVDASNGGVVIDGSALPASPNTNGVSFCLFATGSAVMGLQVINFPGSGFVLAGTENTLRGILSSGNREAGVNLGPDARRNRIIGNRIGITPGNHSLQYQQAWGVFLAGTSENEIGGTTAAERNVISGNQIEINIAHSSGHNTVSGNYIGTDTSGTHVAPSLQASSSEVGVAFEGYAHDNVVADNIIASGQAVNIADTGSSYNRIIRNRIGVGPDDQPIEGVTASLGNGISVQQPYNLIADNVIGGLRTAAIDIFGAAEVFIVGNRIGTDSSGMRAIPNAPGTASVLFRGARRTFLGGASATERNIISGNGGPGIEIPTGSNHNFIIGNAIGASASSAPLGNAGSGIVIDSSTGNILQRNEITANGGAGVEVRSGPQTTIRRNAISMNLGTGIATTGASSAPPPPVIAALSLSRVEGTTCGGCIVEVFSDNTDEGRVYEGTAVATPGGAFAIESPRGIFLGPFVTATATNAAGTTSAFSSPLQTLPPPPRRRAVRH